MASLHLEFPSCSAHRPRPLKRDKVEEIAAHARQQLGFDAMDAIPLAVLAELSELKINGVAMALEISTDFEVHDENDDPVLGICEHDPSMPDTAMVSVSPVSERGNEAVVLSTLAHELGHAIFDAPGWIVEAARGRGLFDDIETMHRRSYRTTTGDANHLGHAANAKEPDSSLAKAVFFAEFRANEFMGSLLVPRVRLQRAIFELAPKFAVSSGRNRHLEMTAELCATSPAPDRGVVKEELEPDSLLKALAERFGVNRRFIEVRLDRYGLAAC